MSRWSTLRKAFLESREPKFAPAVPEEEELLVVFEPEAKGVCRKCNRHIGRGVRFHERKCPGQ